MEKSKNNRLRVTVLASLLLALGSSGPGLAPSVVGQEAKPAVEKKINDPASILAADAKKLIDTRKDLVIVDVRSPLEFGQGSLPGSRNIPFIDIMEGRHDLPKDKPVLLVCSIGGRSFAAVQLLQEKGYKEVYNLDGGTEAWQRARLPLKH